MDTALITYSGELRTDAKHVRSGQHIVTDAPVDNKGKGSAFSPTDLLATSLATCMITTIGIMADGKGIGIDAMEARVIKHMASDPRRVQRVEIHLNVKGSDLGEKEKLIIERTARTCPVAVSLHADLVIDLRIEFN